MIQNSGPGGEIENFLVVREDDQCRKAQLGMDLYDVFLAVLDYACSGSDANACVLNKVTSAIQNRNSRIAELFCDS